MMETNPCHLIASPRDQHKEQPNHNHLRLDIIHIKIARDIIHTTINHIARISKPIEAQGSEEGRYEKHVPVTVQLDVAWA